MLYLFYGMSFLTLLYFLSSFVFVFLFPKKGNEIFSFLFFLLILFLINIFSVIRGTGLLGLYTKLSLVAFILAFFIINAKFEISILKYSYIVISIILIFLQINYLYNPLPSDESIFGGNGSSSNTISVILLNICALIYFIEIKQNKSVTLWIPLFCTLGSFVALNRSGIICSVLLILIVTSQIKRKGLFTFFLFFIVVGSFFYLGELTFFFDVADLISNKTDSVNYSDNPRHEILLGYINQIDLYKIILGQDLNSIPTIAFWNGNPHNSFVLLFATCGMWAFFYLYVLIRSLIYYLKKNLFLFGVMLILLLRSWSDTTYFGSIFDPFIFTYGLYPFFKKDIRRAL